MSSRSDAPQVLASPDLASPETDEAGAAGTEAAPLPPARDPGEIADLKVSAASLDEWRQIVEWATAEGWNPGRADTECFHPTDPAGFFIGRLGDRAVSAVSVVTYSDRFAFLGHYLVHPDFRGRGLGLATWRAAVPHAGDRTIGLDAVPAQLETYRRAGFSPVYRTLRYKGRPTRNGTRGDSGGEIRGEIRGTTDGAAHGGGRPQGEPVEAVGASDRLDAVAAYDLRCFPADRREFLARWLTQEGHRAYARLRGGEVTGYGVIRPAHGAWRIGPLFADSPQDAEALFDALVSEVGPDDEVGIDIPEPNSGAIEFAASRGLSVDSHTTRMYTAGAYGDGPEDPLDRTYGFTSLELG